MRKYLVLLLLSLFLTLNLFIFPSRASNEQEFQLRISIVIRNNLLFPVQTFPISVLFEIENIGNRTFNGKATLEVTTEKRPYSPKIFLIHNLTKGEVYENSSSYATDYEGRYWATVKIEADDLSRIFLYEDSTLEGNASRVEYTNSSYLYSLRLFVAMLGVSIAVVSVTIAYLTYRKRKTEELTDRGNSIAPDKS